MPSGVVEVRTILPPSLWRGESLGDERIRTDGLMRAKHAFYQLNYIPGRTGGNGGRMMRESYQDVHWVLESHPDGIQSPPSALLPQRAPTHSGGANPRNGAVLSLAEEEIYIGGARCAKS